MGSGLLAKCAARVGKPAMARAIWASSRNPPSQPSSSRWLRLAV